jgi:hypothetical protein
MSFDIIGQNGTYFYVNNTGWAALLQLAVQYGWEPAGTQAPGFMARGHAIASKDWDGSYTFNDGQTVTDTDAKALAAALRRASLDRCGTQLGALAAELAAVAAAGPFTIA